jgi:hypothetical protein
MSRALIPIFTVVAAAAVVWATVASGNGAAESIQSQLDGQLARSGQAFRAAVSASEHRALALALESARDAGLRRVVESRRAAAPDQETIVAAAGAVAALAEKRGDGERAVFLGLANGKGAAESRMGEPARFGLDKLPLAESALAGSGRAGWVEVDGKTLRLAAVPVGGDDRPAGALVVGFEVDDRLAQRLASEVGAAVTLLQGPRVIASSLSAEERSQIASAARAEEGAFSVGSAPDGFSFLGVALPLGGATPSRVRALGLPVPGAEGLRAILSTDGAAALAPVAAGQEQGLWAALAVLVIGLAFAFVGRKAGAGAKVGELADAAEALVNGDLSLRAPEGLPGELGRISDAVNRLFARKAVETELASRAQAAEAVAAKILERQANRTPPPVDPAPAPADTRETDTREMAAPPAPAPEPTPAPAWEPPVTPPPFEPPLPPPAPESGDAPGSFWDRPTQSISTEDAMAAVRSAESELGGALEHGRGTSPEPFNPEATVVAAVPEALLRATSRAPARPVLSSPVPAQDPDEAHFEQVFRDFVATRERCGEPTHGLGYDRFAAKLRKNREQLMEKYHCRSVRFTVYVKEGRAALKATPIKD